MTEPHRDEPASDPEHPDFDPHDRPIASRTGFWSLVLGAVGLVFSLFGGAILGVAAIVLAIVSLATPARLRGQALGGLGFGVLSVAGTLLLVVNVFPEIQADLQLPSFLPDPSSVPEN